MKTLLALVLFALGLAETLAAQSLTVAWDPSTTGGVPVGYVVERAPGLNATTGFTKLTTVLAPATSYEDKSVLPATAYSYRVFAYNDTDQSPYSNVASATTRAAAPGAPSNNKVTPPPAYKVASLPAGARMTIANTYATNVKPNPNDPVMRIHPEDGGLLVTAN